jgi:hypothetical protein
VVSLLRKNGDHFDPEKLVIFVADFTGQYIPESGGHIHEILQQGKQALTLLKVLFSFI